MIINNAISVANRYLVMAQCATGRLCREGKMGRRQKHAQRRLEWKKAKHPHSSREKKIYHRSPSARRCGYVMFREALSCNSRTTWYAITLINTVLIHRTALGCAFFSLRSAISWINSALIYRLGSGALNLRADTSRCTTYDVQADMSISRACNVTRDTKKRYYLHDDWRELIPAFFSSRAGHARFLSHTFVYVVDVTITTPTFQSITIKRGSLYDCTAVLL